MRRRSTVHVCIVVTRWKRRRESLRSTGRHVGRTRRQRLGDLRIGHSDEWRSVGKRGPRIWLERGTVGDGETWKKA
ncbi:unnamed protein product [Protopolystoma xenopodis]|uniref:Uncharacterized protein n=1 Tax=Protopolystoma xenopodis TaxID=117903 RepID=A0A3S5FCR0_9PLAT|nr:unnamed protein product [Protopolystoma xenopodis]